MRKLLSSMLAVLVLAGAASVCHAADAAKPLVVVSFAGYDKLVADIGLIGKLGGNAELGKQIEMMALMLPQGEGSKGPLSLHTKQPWGAVLSSNGTDMSYYGFIPVSEIKPSLELAKAQLGQEIKEEKGVYQFVVSGKTVFVTHKGKWAYVADSADKLANVVADPATLLGDLPKRYTLAARFSVSDLPKEYRDQFLAQIRAGAEVGINQLPSGNGDDAEVKATVAKNSVEQFTTLVNDADTVVLGWNIDAKTKTTYLDLEVTAKSGTKLAEQFAEVKPGKTNFAGLLLPNAAITLNSVGTMSDNEVAQAKKGLAELRKSATTGLESQGLTDDEVKLATRLVNDALDVLQKTIDTRKTDMAASLVLDSTAMTFVAGMAIAEGEKLDKVVQQLVAEVKKSQGAADAVKMSEETVDGVHVYVASMPTPEDSAKPFFGDNIEVAVGFGKDKAFVAAGRDAVKTLKVALGNLKTTAAKEVPPFQMTMALTQVAKFIAEVSDDAQAKSTMAMVSGILEKAGKQNHLTVTAQAVERGVRVRVELEEGVLKALGSFGQMMSGMTAPGGDK